MIKSKTYFENTPAGFKQIVLTEILHLHFLKYNNSGTNCSPYRVLQYYQVVAVKFITVEQYVVYEKGITDDTRLLDTQDASQYKFVTSGTSESGFHTFGDVIVHISLIAGGCLLTVSQNMQLPWLLYATFRFC